MTWSGVWVAVVTPFKNNKLDEEKFGKLVQHLLDEGVNGIIPAGTTGEGTALEDEEFAKLVEIALEKTGGKIPVVAGTGTTSTKKTAERTKLAKEVGAQGALVVTPYYVKPTHEGFLRHYEEVANVELPIMLYNVPGRTAVNMRPETVEKLAVHPSIQAIKECGPLPQVAELIQRVGDKITILTGEDGVLVPFLALGGQGIVSVAANVVPTKIVAIYHSFMRGDWKAARGEFLTLTRLLQLLFVESNPIPVKCALAQLGWIDNEIRSPLAPLQKKHAEVLRAELTKLGLEVT